MLTGSRFSLECYSSIQKKYAEFIRYYRRHLFKYIKLFEKSFGVKLKFYQKMILFIPSNEQRRQKRIDKVISKFQNKQFLKINKL